MDADKPSVEDSAKHEYLDLERSVSGKTDGLKSRHGIRNCFGLGLQIVVVQRSGRFPFALPCDPISVDANLVIQPRSGVKPIVLGDALGNAQDFGGFGVGHADEVTEFDQLGFDFVLGG
jgi:hypothetical protein